jgi:hypothetical protein
VAGLHVSPGEHSLGIFTQPPNGLQKSIVHSFPSSQGTSTFSQTPAALHVSAVQSFQSLQSASTVHGAVPQLPVAGSQVSPGEHHFGMFTQPVNGSHQSIVHKFPSSQETSVEEQTPALHVSVVQA